MIIRQLPMNHYARKRCRMVLRNEVKVLDPITLRLIHRK